MIKYLVKRWFLFKWLYIMVDRIEFQHRSAWCLSDVPTTVLRWYAIYGMEQLVEFSKFSEYWENVYLRVFDVVCDELEVREMRRANKLKRDTE